MNNPTDHDLLVRLVNDMCWLKKIVSNHLRRHFLISITLLGAVLSLITYLVLK